MMCEPCKINKRDHTLLVHAMLIMNFTPVTRKVSYKSFLRLFLQSKKIRETEKP